MWEWELFHIFISSNKVELESEGNDSQGGNSGGVWIIRVAFWGWTPEGGGYLIALACNQRTSSVILNIESKWASTAVSVYYIHITKWDSTLKIIFQKQILCTSQGPQHVPALPHIIVGNMGKKWVIVYNVHKVINRFLVFLEYSMIENFCPK